MRCIQSHRETARGIKPNRFLPIAAVALLLSVTHVHAKPIMDKFVSAGKSITVERYEPKETGRRPTVILLHGTSGPRSEHGLYKSAANLLADDGYVVLLVHYFDRTGTKNNDPKLFEELKEFNKSGQRVGLGNQAAKVIRKRFLAWMSAVKDTIRYARKLPSVDSSRIGLMGFSLGGFLALSVAAQPDVDVAAVVELCGGLPEEMKSNVRNLPPTFVIHGGRDQIVPVKAAHDLRHSGELHGLPIKVKIFPDADHGMTDKNGKCDWITIAKVTVLVRSYLHESLARD